MKLNSTVTRTRLCLSFQYPQPRVYAMKPTMIPDLRCQVKLSVPSTSGLRDETTRPAKNATTYTTLSVPSTSGLRDETLLWVLQSQMASTFQYPQPRVYAMKLCSHGKATSLYHPFQYPQPRVYAMKRLSQRVIDLVLAAFSTLNLGSTR